MNMKTKIIKKVNLIFTALVVLFVITVITFDIVNFIGTGSGINWWRNITFALIAFFVMFNYILIDKIFGKIFDKYGIDIKHYEKYRSKKRQLIKGIISLLIGGIMVFLHIAAIDNNIRWVLILPFIFGIYSTFTIRCV